jgi:hypothetical protein
MAVQYEQKRIATEKEIGLLYRQEFTDDPKNAKFGGLVDARDRAQPLPRDSDEFAESYQCRRTIECRLPSAPVVGNDK